MSYRCGYGKLNQRVRVPQNHHLIFLRDMNPLTLVKRVQKLNSREADLGISESASWHAKYKESAYVFVGGIPYDLTEGDLLAVFAQYGEIVDVNLVRDKSTGKSKGFAFIAYEDQRSTNLAVDNFNGAQILGRIIRVDHVSHYKKKEEDDEETERQKREERGVCRAFQRGECTRGDTCKFSHDEQRAANTGWGHEEDRRSKWGHEKFEGHRRKDKQSSDILSNLDTKHRSLERHKAGDHDSRRHDTREDWYKHSEDDSGRRGGRHRSSRPELREKTVHREDRDRRDSNNKLLREDRSKEDYLGWKEEKKARRHVEQYDHRESQDRKVRDKDSERRSFHARDSSSVHVRDRDDEDHRESRDEKVRDRYSERSYHASDSSSAHHRGRDDEDYHRSRR